MMASSSSSSQVSQTKYDVFISFRGIDVRDGLLSHLEKALKQKEIDFYVDKRLESGDEISHALPKAIDESLISLIIFSENYASSKWCLEELEKIMDCMQRHQQIVIPIFYNIDPSDVRHQKGFYGDAFTKHDINYKEKAQIWRSSLHKAANLFGFHSSQHKNEAELVEHVVKSLSTRLNIMHPCDLRNLVGIEEKIEELQSLLHQESQNVYVIGIWGMGGIGKTTLAAAIFNRFCFEYEGSCFSANVREESQRHGIMYLKEKILSSLLKENVLNIGPHGLSSSVTRKLQRKKVFLVLDDINDSRQLENLVGTLDYFGPGSRIIITTREKEVLNGKVDKTYEVKPLLVNEALELFNLHAFGENCIDEEWNKLSKEVIDYAKELPLALKALGSFLRGNKKEEWKSQLEKLKKMPFKKINDVLRLSYDTLDRQQKDVFLYIACCFKEYKKSRVIAFLDACGFSTTIELKVLRDKALITWTSETSEISMHDLIQEMGREIVRENSKDDPSKWIHLWDSKDIYDVLQNNKGTVNIQSITLNQSFVNEDFLLNPRVFAKMYKLKFLRISCFMDWQRKKSHPCRSLEFIPNELRLLHWKWCPLKSLPPTKWANNLVELHLTHSNLQELWDEIIMPLGNLKKVDMSYSKNLVKIPNLSLAKNLEEVDLEWCENLSVVHPSILSLPKLEKLNLSFCQNLTRLLHNDDNSSNSLRYLFLDKCSSLKEFSVTSNNMITLDLSNTAVKEFSVTSENMIKLDLSYTCIKELPSSFGCLRRLECLNLGECKSLTHLPSKLVDLESLLQLCISGCELLQSLPQLPSSIRELWAPGCISLETVQFTSMAGVSLNPNLIGVRLLNCMKLDGHSCSDAGLISVNLKNYAFKSTEERKRLREDYNIEDKFIYPGRTIPKWFKYKTSKGSITVDTSHPKLLGFIFCMILRETESFRVEWLLENNNGETLDLCNMGGYTCDGNRYPAPIDSYHVCICYKECSGSIMERIEESRARNQNPKLSFKFITWEMDRVIKCGLYPVYAMDEDDDDQDDEKEEDEEDDGNEYYKEEEQEDDDDDNEEEEELEMGNKTKRSED